MKKKILITLFLSLIISSVLLGVSLERQGNMFFAEGDSLFKSKNFSAAAENYEKAISAYKQAAKKENAIVDDKINSIIKTNIWKAYYFAKNYPKAIYYLKKTLDLKGDYRLDKSTYKKHILIILKIYKSYLNDVDSAITFLKELDKRQPSYWYKKKIAYLYYKYKKNYAAALEWYKEAKKIKTNSSIVKKIASCYIKQKDYKNAISTYQIYLKTGPTGTALKKTYKNMASLYYNINNMDKAAEYWEKVLKMGFDREIALNLMILYYNQKKLDKSMAKANLLLKHKPNMADAIYYKAKIYYDKGQKKLARKYFAKLVKNPTYGKTAKSFIKSIDSEG